ncbi:MAG: sporulation transcriptional regulator SpoIIID [Clostridia bacterium]|nr:sporulation transcriptional regulator SpoIIID [Clostridia bacterium]
MRSDIKNRVRQEAFYIAETGATVRDTAKVFHFSKSTVHKDVTERLLEIDGELYEKVKKVLQKNLDERHLRGGNATKAKYLKAKRAANL